MLCQMPQRGPVMERIDPTVVSVPERAINATTLRMLPRRCPLDPSHPDAHRLSRFAPVSHRYEYLSLAYDAK